MQRNQKLTGTLAGKSLTSVKSESGSVALSFGDGTRMTVQGTLSSGGAAGATAGVINSALESGSSLQLTLASGSSITFALSDPGGSVLVRDASGKVEYAG